MIILRSPPPVALAPPSGHCGVMVKKLHRCLTSLLVVVSRDVTLMIGGSGDVIEPTDGVIGIGSGGTYATAAARALMTHTDLCAKEIVQASLEIAADICVYTNHDIMIETISE